MNERVTISFAAGLLTMALSLPACVQWQRQEAARICGTSQAAYEHGYNEASRGGTMDTSWIARFCVPERQEPTRQTPVEIFPLSDLEGVGLPGYLADGHAVPEAQIAPDRIKLDKLGGWVLVLYSRAFEGAEVTLTPSPALTLIGTYGTPGTNWQSTETLSVEAAKPYSAPPETVKKRPSDAAISGRIAMVVLIGLALFTWLFIWIAG